MKLSYELGSLRSFLEHNFCLDSFNLGVKLGILGPISDDRRVLLAWPPQRALDEWFNRIVLQIELLLESPIVVLL